ncbi:MAG: hypothetical protein IPL61_03685 [Myxococcales bacterium]|nr:hypothetical protein [Myxococcales bacterium]
MWWFVIGAVALVALALVGDRLLLRPWAAAMASGGAVEPDAGVAQFWAWFRRHAAELRAEPELRRSLASINAELARVHEGVFAELSAGPDAHTLELTADGVIDLFPVVLALHGARPEVAGWRIVAFRQRIDVAHIVITMDGLTLTPPKMKVVVARAGGRLELTLFVPGFTTAEAMARPLYVVLDHAIGEYDLATKVGSVDFADIDQAPPGARSLLDLPALFDQAVPPVN